MKTNRKIYNLSAIYLFIALIFTIASCKPDDVEDVLFTGDNYKNIMQYINDNPDYELFKQIVVSGKMVDALSSYNSNGGVNYTLFLPTNEGVNKYIDESFRFASIDDLINNSDYCAEIVRYHLVNGRIPSFDFPNGALAEKTISNFYLTISFKESDKGVLFSVNDESQVTTTNIDLDNGIVHIIDKMLEPVVFTSFEWIESNSNFSIFTELLSSCGLADTLNAFELDELGRKIYNEFTLFAESNALYASNGINSFTDLVNTIGTNENASSDLKDASNLVNQYARYHILEKSLFLDELTTDVYNTYGDLPVSVDLSNVLKINAQSKVYEQIIDNGDTTVIDYLQIKIDESNIVTRSGAIHQLDHLLFPYLPGRKTVTYQFYEEPIINAIKNYEGSYLISTDELEFINLTGSSRLTYTKSTTDVPGASSRDYITLSGDIDFSFVTTKILSGRYQLKLVLERGASNFASVQSFVDDKKVGVVIDLTKDSRTFRTFTVGTVEFSEYSTHVVRISTVIPGYVSIDRIIFEPI